MMTLPFPRHMCPISRVGPDPLTRINFGKNLIKRLVYFFFLPLGEFVESVHQH